MQELLLMVPKKNKARGFELRSCLLSGEHKRGLSHEIFWSHCLGTWQRDTELMLSACCPWAVLQTGGLRGFGRIATVLQHLQGLNRKKTLLDMGNLGFSVVAKVCL